MRSDVLTGNALLVSKEKGKGKLSRAVHNKATATVRNERNEKR